MILTEAMNLITATHLTAIEGGYRASGIHMQSGPGLGKSESVFQVVARIARVTQQPVGLVVMMLANLTSPDVIGFMLPVKGANGIARASFTLPPWYPDKENMWVFDPTTKNADGTLGVWFEPSTWTGPVPEIGVLFLDEFSQADEDVKKPAAELVLNGNVGVARLTRNWRVLSAGNRVGDRSGVMREMMHIISRRNLMDLKPSLDAWNAWADGLPDKDRPHHLTVSFVNTHSEVVFKDALPDKAEPYCCPRTQVRLDRDLRALRGAEDRKHDRLPLSDLALEYSTGWIGNGAAGQYFAHLKFADMIPTIDEIERDPAGCKLPDRRDGQLVCAYMLPSKITDANAGQVLAYLQRLQRDLQVTSVRLLSVQRPDQEQTELASDLKRRQAALMAAPGFAQWLAKNKDLLLAARA